jgi:hypothetical protein
MNYIEFFIIDFIAGAGGEETKEEKNNADQVKKNADQVFDVIVAPFALRGPS